MKRTLIYIEPESVQNAVDLLGTVRQIYRDEPYETFALVINGDSSSLSGKFNVILEVTDENISDFDQIAVADMLVHMHQKYGFSSILIQATQWGRMLAPRVAMMLDTGIVADVTEISHSDEGLELVRPAYSGRIMAGIKIKGDGPVMMTVRPGIFSYAATNSVMTRDIEAEKLTYRNGGIRQLQKKKKTIEYDISDSNILISGGGGISNDFEALEPLAQALGGQVSASRAIVDKGIVSRNFQVGQSGKTVSPGLYIALGINGAIQHVEGLKNVNYIISVNTNKDAPICSLSDIVVEGDAVTFIKELIKKIKMENE
jgi:electron transfer flavoprotein alpha subunit